MCKGGLNAHHALAYNQGSEALVAIVVQVRFGAAPARRGERGIGPKEQPGRSAMTLRGIRHRLPRFLFAVSVCVLFVAAEAAEAQIGRGGGRRRSSGRGKQSGGNLPRDKGPSESHSQSPGSHRAEIYKFEAATGDEDETLIGFLKVRPMDGGRLLKLVVRSNEQLKVSVAGHDFPVEDYPDILWKGLHCTANWEFQQPEPGSKKPIERMPKELQSLTFETLAVEGKIVAIEGDSLVLKVRPSDDRPWPQREKRQTRRPSGNTNTKKPKRIPQKKLSIRIIDEVASYADAAGHPLGLGDFEIDQDIEAAIVYGGKKNGMLVELKSLTAEEQEEGNQAGERGNQPGPRGRGAPQPRGRGGRRRMGV
jgi:hypothetical protein